MPNRPQPLTEAECVLWYCTECGESGALSILGAGTMWVLEAIMVAHRNSKAVLCPAQTKGLRIQSPNSWFAETMPSRQNTNPSHETESSNKAKS